MAGKRTEAEESRRKMIYSFKPDQINIKFHYFSHKVNNIKQKDDMMALHS